MRSCARDLPHARTSSSPAQTLTEPEYAAATKGAPVWLGELIASAASRAIPSGLEFARYSIDYHYLRNVLFVERRMGPRRAQRHVPRYARALAAWAPYEEAMRELGEKSEALASAEDRGKGGSK